MTITNTGATPETVRSGTAVRITNSSYGTVPEGALGTVSTKYGDHKGGAYGIVLTEATAAFEQGKEVAFCRDQFEVITRTETTVEDLAVGDKVRMVYPSGGPAYWEVFGQVGTVAALPGELGHGLVEIDFDDRSSLMVAFAWRLELVEPKPEPQEVIPDGTVVRITETDYDSVPNGTLGTIAAKYNQYRGGCYGIELTKDMGAFDEGEAVSFYRDQFEVVAKTDLTEADLGVGDKVRMVYPENAYYTPVLGRVGEVIPLNSVFASEGEGLVTVKFEDDTVTCYTYRLELVKDFIPGEPVEDLSTLSAGDIVNVRWDGERIQGKLYESDGHLRISASSSWTPNYEPYVVLLSSGSPRVAGAIFDVRLVEKGESDWDRAGRELAEADPGFEVGDRVKVVTTPVSVDSPLDEIEEIEVGSTHVIVDAFGDGDYKIEVDFDYFWVAGACLELDTPIQVGEVVTTREQLDALPWLSIVANDSGCSMVKGGGRNRDGWMFWNGDVKGVDYTTHFIQDGTFRVIYLGVG